MAIHANILDIVSHNVFGYTVRPDMQDSIEFVCRGALLSIEKERSWHYMKHEEQYRLMEGGDAPDVTRLKEPTAVFLRNGGNFVPLGRAEMEAVQDMHRTLGFPSYYSISGDMMFFSPDIDFSLYADGEVGAVRYKDVFMTGCWFTEAFAWTDDLSGYAESALNLLEQLVIDRATIEFSRKYNYSEKMAFYGQQYEQHYSECCKNDYNRKIGGYKKVYRDF